MADKDPLMSRSKCGSKSWRKGWFIDVLCISLTTIVLIATFVVNGLAASSDPQQFGFANTTGSISDRFYTEVTPSGWAFSIWGIIYFWQAVWILYGWTQVFRPCANRTIFPAIYLIYAFTNICNIIWVYVWGNNYPQAAFPFLLLVATSNWCSSGIEMFYLNRIAGRPPSERLLEFKIDYYLSQLIIVNGITVYDTWTTVASLINLAAVLQYFGNVSAVNSGTIALSILTFVLIGYFILETILDQLHRFVFITYPVIIWALSAVLTASGIDGRNGIFTLVLLILTCIILVVRCILWVVFGIFRPINSTKLFKYKEVV